MRAIAFGLGGQRVLTKIHTRKLLLIPLRGVGWRGYLVMKRRILNAVK
jgi:hypothetical protein